MLLSGQTFTNGVLGILCAGSAVVLAIGPARDRSISLTGRWACGIIVGLGALVVLVLLALLPSGYRFQEQFNREVEQARANSTSAG